MESTGVGRIDHVENRLVGIKSREVYEAPAGVVLHSAHKALEAMTLSKEQARLKARIVQEYADVVYNGLWFTRHRRDLDAYVRSTQEYVSGTVRVKLLKGRCSVWGEDLPMPSTVTTWPPTTAATNSTIGRRRGFISIYGLPVRTQARVQEDREE